MYAPLNSVSTNFTLASPAMSLADARARHRNHELSAPGADAGHLLDYLILEIPRQDQNVIRLSLEYAVWMHDRDARARQEHALLVRIAVYRELQEIGAYPAIVEKSVCLRRRAV